MPQGDGTGPRGQGPLTGRGLGSCGGGMRRGFGLGRGFGMDWRFCRRGTAIGLQNQNVQPLTKKEEKEILEEDLKDLEEEKKEIERRLKELK